MTKKAIIEYLKQNKELLKQDNFVELYENFLNDQEYDKLSETLLECGITAEEILQDFTYVPIRMFSSIDSIQSVKIHDRIETLHEEAFCYCSNLSKIDLGRVKVLDKDCLSLCPLKTIFIPDTVEVMNFQCFSCVPLKEVKVPKSIITLHTAAFRGCNNLQKIYLPESFRAKHSFIEEMIYESGCRTNIVDVKFY